MKPVQVNKLTGAQKPPSSEHRDDVLSNHSEPCLFCNRYRDIPMHPERVQCVLSERRAIGIENSMLTFSDSKFAIA